jgi:1,4-dihydroxy-2-naphthoate octaprenyltransferase
MQQTSDDDTHPTSEEARAVEIQGSVVGSSRNGRGVPSEPILNAQNLPSGGDGGMARRGWDLLVHLRLHFQLMLASIFLLGYVLAGGGVNRRGALAFAIVHLCLYGGATAFNSYFDRDEGPVGGLASPPPVRPELFVFSSGLQVLGLILAAFVGIDFWAICGAMIVLSIGYSHPMVRWKARPWSSLLVVSIGQGVLGFDLGVLASGTGAKYLQHPDLILGALTTTLVTTGLYPLTQVYQIEEDRRRGDRTFAVAFGVTGCYRLSLALLALAGICAVVLFTREFGRWQAVLVGAVITGAWVRIALWSRGIESAVGDPVATMRRTMVLAYATSGGFGLFLIAHLLRIV